VYFIGLIKICENKYNSFICFDSLGKQGNRIVKFATLLS